MAAPAAAQISRILGFIADSATPRPAAFPHDNASMAVIHLGKVEPASNFGRRHHWRTPRRNRSTPNDTKSQLLTVDAEESDPPPLPSFASRTTNRTVTPAIPATQPLRKPTPVSVGRRASNITIAAITGTGLSATATA